MDKWLNHPTAIKIMSLVIGVIMWAVVHFDPESTPDNVASLTETRTISGVQIEAFGLDERSYLLRSIEPETVRLTVRGSRSDLQLMSTRKDDDMVKVDLSSLTEGTHTLSPQLDLPRGIQLVEMSPGSVTVTIEALQTKEFVLDMQLEGKPAEGYIAGTPIVRPTNRVHVTLPENTLAQVSRVGAIISVDGETKSIQGRAVKLAAYDEKGSVIEGAIIDPAVVEVDVPITYPYKTVPLQFVMAGQLPAGLSIGNFEPNVEQVTVYGPQEALDQIEFVNANLQLAELSRSGKVTIPLTVTAPVIEISPPEVEINIEVVLSDTRTLEGLPINFKGLGEGMAVKILEPATGKADIVVVGSSDRLGRLQPGDVTVDADLTGKGPGIHTVNLVVNSPRFIDQSGGTSTATVEITLLEPASADPEADAVGGSGGEGTPASDGGGNAGGADGEAAGGKARP